MKSQMASAVMIIYYACFVGKLSVDEDREAYYPGYLTSLRNPRFAMIKTEYDTIARLTSAQVVRDLRR